MEHFDKIVKFDKSINGHCEKKLTKSQKKNCKNHLKIKCSLLFCY